MKITQQTQGPPDYPYDRILRQVEKINQSASFASSEILRSFLQFIVAETAEGNTNRLKEYTIAVKVLNKPTTFDPKENCIVRIHAVRLRKALNEYYNGPGALDEIRISLPKGHYIPIFSENPPRLMNAVLNPSYQKEILKGGNNMTIAVIPFHNLDRKQVVRKFSDGLGVQLSSALMKLGSLSVISYNTSRRMYEHCSDIRKLGLAVNAQYVFTGDVQCQNNAMRVTIQMIKAETRELVWSEMFEKKLTESNCFQTQDEIVDKVVKDVQLRTTRMYSAEDHSVSVMATA